MINLIEIIDEERILLNILKIYFTEYNKCLVIKCIDPDDDIEKINEFKYLKRDIFSLFERRKINVDSKFIVIRDETLRKKLDL